jgi:hypothetical protein
MAKAAKTPTSMTMILVRQAFSKRRLRRSSYAGQKRMGVTKPGLKKYRKMQDIQGEKHLSNSMGSQHILKVTMSDLVLTCRVESPEP